MKRFFFILLLVTTAIFIHPIFSIVLGLIFALISQHAFYEIIILGIIIDVLYQTIIVFPWFQIPLYTFVSLILFFSLFFIKKQLSFHA
jgi:hypothetical protein